MALVLVSAPAPRAVWCCCCLALLLVLLLSGCARAQIVCNNNTCFTPVFGLTVQNVSVFNITASSSNVRIDLCPAAPCVSRTAVLKNVSFLSLTFPQSNARTNASGTLSVTLENCTIRNGISLVDDAQFLALRVTACTFGSQSTRASNAGVVIGVSLFRVRLTFHGLVVFAAQFGVQLGPGQFNYSEVVVQDSSVDGTTAAVNVQVSLLYLGLLVFRNSELSSSSNDGVSITTEALVMQSSVFCIQDNWISTQKNCVVANSLNYLTLESSSLLLEGNTMTAAADVPILFRSSTRTLYTMEAATWAIRGNNISAMRSSGAVVKLFWDHTQIDNVWTIAAESAFRIDGNSIDGGLNGVHLYWLSSSVGSVITLSQTSLLSISCNIIGATGNGIQLRWNHDNNVYARDNILVASQGSMVIFSGNVFLNAATPLSLLWEWYTGNWTFTDTARLLVFRNDAQGNSATALFTVAFSPARMALSSTLPVLVVHNRANNPTVLLVSVTNASPVTLPWMIGCNSRVNNVVSGAPLTFVSQVTGRQCDGGLDVGEYLFACRTATPSLTNGVASATATVALSNSQTMEAWFVRRPTPPSPPQGIVPFCTNACAERPGGFIATPRNADENLLVLNALPSYVSSALLGGSRLFDNKTYRWFSGPLGRLAGGAGPVFFTNVTFATGVCVSPPFFCNFNAQEPNNYPNGAPNVLNEFLIYMLGPMSGIKGYWNDDNDERGTGCACFRHLGITPSVSPTLPEPSHSIATVSLSAASHTHSHSKSSASSASKSPPSATLQTSSTRSMSASFYTQTLRPTWMVVDNDTFSGVSLAVAPPSPPASDSGNGTSTAPSVTGFVLLFGTEFSPFLSTIRNTTSVNCVVVPTNASRGTPANPSHSGAQRVREFVWTTSIITPITATAAMLELVASNAVYFDLSETVAVEIGVDGACLARADLPMLTTTIFITPAISSPADTNLLRNSQIVASTLAVVNPIVAVQAQRNTLALTLQYCVLDQAVSVAQSPTRIELGRTAVSAYVGAAVMNFALVLGLAVVQLAVAAVARGCFSGSVAPSAQQAFSAARFPSLLAIPAMILLEPTAAAAVIAILYGEEMAFVGIVSTVLCVATPLAVGLYLRATFAAVVIDRSTADHLTNFPPPPPGGDLATENAGDNEGNATANSQSTAAVSVHPVYGFMFGYGKWVDNTKRYGSAAAGYCQRSRYFFKEYRDGCQWYMIVELSMAVMLGSLEGIKLGYGRCTEVLATATAIMSLYLIAFLRFRPCSSGSANLFIVSLTSLQATSCILLLLPGEHTQTAVILSGVASYLLMAKCCVDVMEVASHAYRKIRHRLQISHERYQQEHQRHQEIDALTEYDIPTGIACLPLSLLMDQVSQKASHFPLLQKHRVVDMLNEHGFRALRSLSAALTACVNENTAIMKQSASFKSSVDGIWRDWRKETSAVPVELLALESQLRGISTGAGADVQKRPHTKKPLALPRSGAPVVTGDLIIHDAGDEPNLPLLSKDDDATELQDMTLQAILADDPVTPFSHHHTVFQSDMGVDDNGLLVFGVKDDPWFPEEEREEV